MLSNNISVGVCRSTLDFKHIIVPDISELNYKQDYIKTNLKKGKQKVYDKTFVQLLREGVLIDPENDVEDIINYWTDNKEKENLPDLRIYLGMSVSIYNLFLTNPTLCYQTILQYGKIDNENTKLV